MNFIMKSRLQLLLKQFAYIFFLLITLSAAKQSYGVPKQVKYAFVKSFTFVVFGDTRSNPDYHKDVIQQIVSIHPEFIMQTGDLVSNGHNKAQWDEFTSIEAPIKRGGIGYYPCRGNHDLGQYYPMLSIGPHSSGGNGNYYYAFTKHNNRFIVLDSLDADQYSPSSSQYVWLVKELAASQRNADHTFVMFHESPFSVGPHGPTTEAVKYLHPLFIKYHVTAVFCGHDHLYYRTYRDGIYYVITGGGGAPLYDPENSQLAVSGDVYAKDHHYVKVQINGKAISITAIKVETGDPLEQNDRVLITNRGEHHSPIVSNVIDQFVINALTGKSPGIKTR